MYYRVSLTKIVTNLEGNDTTIWTSYIIWCPFSLSHVLRISKFYTDKRHVLWENKSIDISIYSHVDQITIELYFCLMKLLGDNLISVVACCCVIWSVSNTNSSTVLLYNTNTTDGEGKVTELNVFSDRASWIDYTLITNLMHWLLFINKILYSSTCFEHQVLIFRRT